MIEFNRLHVFFLDSRIDGKKLRFERFSKNSFKSWDYHRRKPVSSHRFMKVMKLRREKLLDRARHRFPPKTKWKEILLECKLLFPLCFYLTIHSACFNVYLTNIHFRVDYVRVYIYVFLFFQRKYREMERNDRK